MGKFSRQPKNLFIFGLLFSILILTFQNCTSRTGFRTIAVSSGLALQNTSDNGQGYDGKTIVLHHYVDGFTCEGRVQPESILISEQKDSWTIIRNQSARCHVIAGEVVNGVAFDSVTKQAQFEGKTYVPPKPYLVDANEDPNLPDVQLDDGVCEDVNGKCSVLAGVQQAGFSTGTSDATVKIPAATYLISAPLTLTTLGHDVKISGPVGRGALIDGQSLTNLFVLIANSSGKITFENLTLKNAGTPFTHDGAAITAHNFDQLDIVNCAITGARADYSLMFFNSVGHLPHELKIIGSDFDGNSALMIGGMDSFVLQDTTITNSIAYGIILSGTSRVLIDRSSITHSGTAMTVAAVNDFRLQNSTLYQNDIGVHFFNGNSLSEKAVIQNSTIYQNTSATFPNQTNIYFENSIAGHEYTIQNSIIAMEGLGPPNCKQSANAVILKATNSIIDDASCGQTGLGNISAAPRLSGFANNGGPTFTLMPLAGSPAIDAGDATSCVAVDQRSSARVRTCDIGSVEAP